MNYMFAKSRAKAAANSGIGAIKPATCHAFLDGKCSCCGIEIPDFTILGNAWVIAEEGVELLCVKCRTSEKVASRVNAPYLRGHFDRSKIFLFIVDLNKRDRRAWLRLIFGCRMNQHSLTFPLFYDQAFDIQFVDSLEDEYMAEDIIYELNKTATAHSYYGEMRHQQKCGECSATLDDVINPKRCKHCNFPNKRQWNMRDTYKSEIKRAALLNL
jgi:hypothetical protein